MCDKLERRNSLSCPALSHTWLQNDVFFHYKHKPFGAWGHGIFNPCSAPAAQLFLFNSVINSGNNSKSGEVFLSTKQKYHKIGCMQLLRHSPVLQNPQLPNWFDITLFTPLLWQNWHFWDAHKCYQYRGSSEEFQGINDIFFNQFGISGLQETWITENKLYWAFFPPLSQSNTGV